MAISDNVIGALISVDSTMHAKMKEMARLERSTQHDVVLHGYGKAERLRQELWNAESDSDVQAIFNSRQVRYLGDPAQDKAEGYIYGVQPHLRDQEKEFIWSLIILMHDGLKKAGLDVKLDPEAQALATSKPPIKNTPKEEIEIREKLWHAMVAKEKNKYDPADRGKK